MVRPTRATSTSSWWNDYNSFAISDYWHEFSRGKLHILGRAESVILSNSTSWYSHNGGIAKVNKDVYDILSQRLEADWLRFDRWKITDTGIFAWQKDKLADMVYMVFRQWKSFLFDNGNFWGYATLGTCSTSVNNSYTVYKSGQDTVRIYSIAAADSLGSGIRIHADSGN